MIGKIKEKLVQQYQEVLKGDAKGKPGIELSSIVDEYQSQLKITQKEKNRHKNKQ